MLHGSITNAVCRRCVLCQQNIKQIVDAIHTTAYLGVMHALLGCYSERRLWQLRHGSLAPQTLSDIMMDERNSWALCQKDIKGLYVMDAELRDRLKRQGVEVRGNATRALVLPCCLLTPQPFVHTRRPPPTSGRLR